MRIKKQENLKSEKWRKQRIKEEALKCRKYKSFENRK